MDDDAVADRAAGDREDDGAVNASYLSAAEARVLGCLLEKELATPQYYPLTLNALVLACNQTSNRDPVVQFSESDAGGAVASLRDKGLARIVHSSGQRAAKYRHAIDTRWGLDDQHRALLAVLLLRGPQTLNELRTRTERLAPFASHAEVEDVLGLLARREEPLARRLERAPGQREERWTDLLAEHATEPHAAGSPGSVPESAGTGGSGTGHVPRDVGLQIEELRREVSELREMVELLLESSGRSTGQPTTMG